MNKMKRRFPVFAAYLVILATIIFLYDRCISYWGLGDSLIGGMAFALVAIAIAFVTMRFAIHIEGRIDSAMSRLADFENNGGWSKES